MRDFDRLEELSTTVQAGLEANDVIWAIDQALAGAELDEEAVQALTKGGEILEGLANPDPPSQPAGPPLAQKMLGGEGGRNVRSIIILATKMEGEDAESIDVSEVLKGMSEALAAIARREEIEPYQGQLEASLEIFAAIGELKLGQGNGIVRAQKEQAPWTARTMTLPSF